MISIMKSIYDTETPLMNKEKKLVKKEGQLIKKEEETLNQLKDAFQPGDFVRNIKAYIY